MKFLLDTNFVSEWTKPQPNGGVVAWLDEADENSLFLSVATLAELRFGVDRLAAGKRRTQLDSWVREELPSRFESRILPMDESVADAWGRISARCEARGRPIGTMDALIAATAEVHALVVVTRNTAHFLLTTAEVMSPWT